MSDYVTQEELMEELRILKAELPEDRQGMLENWISNVESSLTKAWDRIYELEREVNRLKSDVWSNTDKTRSLETDVSNLQRGY
jgi:polyhydroxyalkanoate synthesis regulator phasin